MRISRTFLGLAALVLALAPMPVRQASACLNDELDRDAARIRQTLWRIEELIHRNQPERALRRVPSLLRQRRLESIHESVRAVAQIATVRLDGDVRGSRPHPRPRTTPEEREANLRAAVAFFEGPMSARMLHHELWHAEALASLPDGIPAAEAKLVSLEERDFGRSAMFMATKMRIRLRAGDLEGARGAHEECVELSRRSQRGYCPRMPATDARRTHGPASNVARDPWS
jgi:hypothetical protein